MVDRDPEAGVELTRLRIRKQNRSEADGTVQRTGHFEIRLRPEAKTKDVRFPQPPLFFVYLYAS